jgi:hypothetical protein
LADDAVDAKRAKLRQTWADMMRRCYNPKAVRWAHYCGRGIKVPPELATFEDFERITGPTWFPGAALHRLFDRDYEPSNLIWLTRSVHQTVHNEKRPYGTLAAWSRKGKMMRRARKHEGLYRPRDMEEVG